MSGALGSRYAHSTKKNCTTVDASPKENEFAHERWCNDLSAKLLCVFVLDRFGDFVSDQVVAPVREMVSQTLASLLLHMPHRSVLHVHSVLLQMINQDFVIPAPSVPQPPQQARGRGKAKAVKQESQKVHIWEVRHAGLLGIKYEVAVRNDLFQQDVKQEVKVEEPEFVYSGKEVLQGVVDAAILGSVYDACSLSYPFF